MTDVQPDLFGGAHVIGAGRGEARRETLQCVGQTDVYSQLLTPSCERCGRACDHLSRNDLCPTCVAVWIKS